MNNTIQELLQRKSTRLFLDQEINESDKKLILEAAIHAPTAGNMQLYSILDITDQNKKNQLADLCDHQPFIAKAKLVLVFVTDPLRYYRNYNRFVTKAKNAKPSLADYFLGLSDALVAAQNAVTAAHALGIGSCYIGDIVENIENVRTFLKLPKYVLPAAMLVFGYPTEQQKRRVKPARLDLQDVVFENEYKECSEEEVFQMFVRRMKKGLSISDELAFKKTIEHFEFMYGFKQDTPFFKEMNRCLKLMYEEYEK